MTRRTALILGATGGIGGAMTRRLLAGGWQVRALTRTDIANLPDVCERCIGDALDPASVSAAAGNADVIVHAVNPPAYRDWGAVGHPHARQYACGGKGERGADRAAG